MEIGNEEYHHQSGTYDARFPQFYKAIRQRHSQLQLIAATPVTKVRPDILDDNVANAAATFAHTVPKYAIQVIDT